MSGLKMILGAILVLGSVFLYDGVRPTLLINLFGCSLIIADSIESLKEELP